MKTYTPHMILAHSVIILVLCYLGGVPFDESLYHNFAKSISQHGKPWLSEAPDGYFLLFHPYLVFYFQSFWISIGVESIQLLRIVHCLFWVLPSLILIGEIAKEIYQDHLGLSLIFLFGFMFWHVEASTSELDLPFTFFSLLSLWLTWKWHQSLLKNEKIGGKYFIWLMVCMIVGAWVKFQFAMCVITACILTLIFGMHHKKVLKKAMFGSFYICLISFSSFVLWVLFAELLGGDVLNAFKYLVSGVSGKESAYHGVASSYPWYRYLLFSFAYINFPLMFLGGVGILYLWVNKKKELQVYYLIVPIVVTAFMISISGIRVVRYWDAVLPLFSIGAVLPYVNKNFQKKITFWFSCMCSFLILGVVHYYKKDLPEIKMLGFNIDLYQFLSLIVLPLCISTLIFKKLNPFLPSIVGGMLGICVAVSMIHLGYLEQKDPVLSKEIHSINKILQEQCSRNNSLVLGLYKTQLAYGIDCPFYNIELMNKFEELKYKDVKLWVLPKNKNLLNKDLKKEPFIEWIYINYHPFEIDEAFKNHLLMKKNEL